VRRLKNILSKCLYFVTIMSEQISNQQDDAAVNEHLFSWIEVGKTVFVGRGPNMGVLQSMEVVSRIIGQMGRGDIEEVELEMGSGWSVGDTVYIKETPNTMASSLVMKVREVNRD